MSASTGGSAAHYAGIFCTSVQRMGWSGIKNGELLDKMRQKRFDVFITGDRNLQFQQHLPAADVAVGVLRAGSTRLAETLPLIKEVLEQIESLRPGAVTIISNPS